MKRSSPPRVTTATAPHGAVMALGVTVVLPAALASIAWMLGQCTADRWAWAQWIFWTPPWSLALVASLGAACARWCLPRGAVTLAALLVCLVAGAWSAARFAWFDVGWSGAAQAEGGQLTVTHWNPQWPGEDALACGRALAAELGDVTVISGPGSMLRFDAREAWIPPGFTVHDHGVFGVVARVPVLEHRILASATLPDVGTVWLGWVVVRARSGDDIRILVVDLPSSPRRARGTIAAGLETVLAGTDLPAPPDLVVGDLNCTPGSVILGVAAPGMSAAPPWRASGWLCTYRRPWALIKIDHMLASPALSWVSYRTVDLGFSDHRAQVGVLAPTGRAN